MTRTSILTIAVASTALAIAGTIHAQSYLDASSKMRGDYGGSSANRAMSSARGYSQDYRQYASRVQKVDPEVAQDASDAIGSYITKAKKHFAWMRANATKANDKETLTSLDEIDKNLAAAEKGHKDMHEMCTKENVDSAGSMKCCQQIDDSLANAISDHDKLMKKLGMANPASPTKK